MDKRLIDGNELKNQWEKDRGRNFPADYFIHTIDFAPTIDAVVVTRCEKCDYNKDEYCVHYMGICDPIPLKVKPFDYCPYGKPKRGSKINGEKESEGK